MAVRRVAAMAIGWLACGASVATAATGTATLNTRVTMSDGVTLAATVTGQAPLTARPVIVEFSPYGANSGTTQDGPAYNYLLVQDRGTGDSDGEFDALGPRTQLDVEQTLAWACTQPWSNGSLGLNGFSASAITVYNSLHLGLPCVKTAVLKSGTFSLYRDLLYPGGVNNLIPGAGVLGLIGAAALEQGLNRLQRAPLTSLDTTIGLFDVGLEDLGHPTLDSFWQQRQFQGEAQHLPILMLDGWFDVESRGAFQAFQALKGDGAHLLVVGGHDGAPKGTDDGVAKIKEWFDHYLLGAGNGVETQPPVQMLLPEGSRESYIAGKYETYDTTDWPVPGTTWQSLYLSSAHSGIGGGLSVNNGSLADAPASTPTKQSYVAIPTVPTASDVPNTGFLGPDGLNFADTALPLLTETLLAQPLALTYTSPKLTAPLTAVGPAALDVTLSSTAPETDIWAVISDVWPNGTSHPLATGRLDSLYPNIIASQSLTDSAGDVVEPFGDYGTETKTPARVARTYQVEFWPIGNVFRAGDRIQLSIVGASAASPLGIPAINAVTVGGPNASRLLLPALP